MSEAERFFAAQCELGEGPLWHEPEKTLYWVDIEVGHIHKVHHLTKSHEVHEIGLPVGAIVLRERGGFVLATRDGFAYWDSDALLTFIADPEPGKPEARFNDGKVDGAGRFWAGTMSQDSTSSLYRLNAEGIVHTMETGITISNGVGWSPDDRVMYHTDSPQRIIYAYDFDKRKGTIDNRRVFVRLPERDGHPDGLAVDIAGFVWSACWGGGKVIRYAPDGTIDKEVRLPVELVTSCAFGGPNLEELFITTARVGLGPEVLKSQPFAGDVFYYHAGVKGIPVGKYAG